MSKKTSFADGVLRRHFHSGRQDLGFEFGLAFVLVFRVFEVKGGFSFVKIKSYFHG